jgi:hypothetical protein
LYSSTNINNMKIKRWRKFNNGTEEKAEEMEKQN